MKRDQEKEREKNSPQRALGTSRAPAGSPSAAFDLQRKLGNQAILQLLDAGAVQAKLRVSQPGDADEREADRLASQVVSDQPSAVIQRKCSCSEKGEPCSQCGDEELKIGRKNRPNTPAVSSVSDHFLDGLGPGDPLEPSLRTSMESRLGHDFSGVRVHSDALAAGSARAVNARAFTLGNHVVFGEQEYAPHTPGGQKLLAHELTHTVQQGAAPGLARSAARRRPSSASTSKSIQRVGFDDLATAGVTAGAHLASRWLSNPRNKQFANDLLASVKEAPQHAAEILLGEVWEAIKAHWIKFLAVTIGIIAAETVIGILTGAPEPTLITKVIAVILQVLVIAIVGYFAAVELVGVYEEGQNWFTQAKEANGDPAKISEASRSFLRMVRHIILAILTVAGVRAKIRGFSVPKGITAGAEGGSGSLGSSAGETAPKAPPKLRAIEGGKGSGGGGGPVASGGQGAFDGAAARNLQPESEPVIKEAPPLPAEAAKPIPATPTSPTSVPGKFAGPAAGVSAATSEQKEIVKSCATEYPTYRVCAELPSEYVYSSAREALEEIKRRLGKYNLRLHNPSPTTSGPCVGQGTHYNVRDGNDRVASIACCPCCSDTPKGPVALTRCRIVW
ncbi:MAG TPA: DUF4157 domain-containing protein [Candidatus Eisenbacteria bacterium]|nr:DUF4157 domain-containing protein [Candidatus Eisenbacteria bacterium]